MHSPKKATTMGAEHAIDTASGALLQNTSRSRVAQQLSGNNL